MFHHLIVTALRNMRRYRGYTALNITGLAAGLASALFILLWVQDERSYDRFPDNVDQLYRVMRTARHGAGQVSTTPSLTAQLDPVLIRDFPEITSGALFSWPQEMSFSIEGNNHLAEGRHAGTDFFNLFSYPFYAGSPQSALDTPESIVLTVSLAQRLFPALFTPDRPVEEAAALALGNTLHVDQRVMVTVTGVMEDVPQLASQRFEFVLPVEEYIRRNAWVEDWGNNGMRMFVKLDAQADPAVVSEKIRNVISTHTGGSVSTLFLQPYADMYLYSKYEEGELAGGRITYVRLFALIGLFILIISCINFVNLTTARSTQRAQEIGIRKSFGGARKDLALQFLSESVVLALFAMMLAVCIVVLFLPAFNQLTGKQIILPLTDPSAWLVGIGLALGTGLLAGAYPSTYLSNLRILATLRNNGLRATHGGILRKGLVVFQYTLSIILMVGMIAVYQQLDYIHTKNLGFDRDEVFLHPLEGKAETNYDTFRETLLASPHITHVTAGSENPLSVNISTGGPQWDGKDPDDRTLYFVISAAHDYLETMRMEMVQGRAFDPRRATDSSHVVVNEAAVRAMGMENPIGQRLALWGREGQIIGVVKDFHMASLYDPIEPLIIRLDPQPGGMVFVRPAPGQTAEALNTLETVLSDFNPAFPFHYTFLDEAYEEMYRNEAVMGTLTRVFAFLALLVAGLGLFGLASFDAARRTKEIGIRKVMGASTRTLVGLLTRDFFYLILVALALSIPVSMLLIQRWLSSFSYHFTPGVFLFGSAIGVVFLTAALAIGYQSLKAARTNPITALRST